MRWLGLAWLLILSSVVYGFSASGNSAPSIQQNSVVLLSIDGVIGPATDDYIERALNTAEQSRAKLVVIQLDTPGGLDSAMRRIVKNIVNADLPVATYVSPSGARAASAGTYILYASHITAMAPATNLGAATPVAIPTMPTPSKPIKPNFSEPQTTDPEKTSEKSPQKSPDELTGHSPLTDPEKHKAVNDAVAYIKGLAELHGRNAEWAEKAVRQAASLTAQEALEMQVIDLMAVDLDDLLKRLDGRQIELHDRELVLQTSGLEIIAFSPDWRSQLLSVITNPNVAYILMLIGIYGLILEFYSPGAILPGTIGAISLLLAMYAFQLLPINYAGIGLILLGVVLMTAEAFEPSFGVLGLGGITAFVIGSVILIDTQAPGFGIDWAVIASFAALSVLVLVVVVGFAIKSRYTPVVSGAEQLLGGMGVTLADFTVKNEQLYQGTVRIHGEHWQAVSHSPLQSRQIVRVTKVDDLTLTVEAEENEQLHSQPTSEQT